MLKNETDEIKQEYREHIYIIVTKNLLLRTIIPLIIFGYFVYSDIGIRHLYIDLLTRILPVGFTVFLLIFHLFTKQKYKQFKTKTYNLLLLSAIIMMYAKILMHFYDELDTMISGTILVVFIVSLDLKTTTKNTILLYFIPVVIFIVILSLFYEVEKAQFLKLANLFPIIIIGFVANRLHNSKTFQIFKTNYLLEKEKQLSDDLYAETLVMNEDLSQKNEEIISQHDEIEQQHKFITDGINYAKRIQEAMLPKKDIFDKYFQEYFIFYQPKDVVSGDFYWVEKIEDEIICAIADCTGHGVPGAMVSMLGISLLNKVTTQKISLKASEIMEQLRIEVKKSLKQTGEDFHESNDGMDMALCVINIKTKKLQFSGANNSLYILRNKELITLKADKQPISVYIKEKEFTNYEFQLQKDDILYAFSDGYADQFNSENQKFQKSNLKKLLIEIAENKLPKQKELLEKEHKNWKSSTDQTDDILVAGIKIK